MSSESCAPGLVAVPAERRIWTRTTVALLELQNVLPAGWDLCFQVTACTLAQKRNMAVRRLLETPGKRWLLNLDSDMKPPRDVVQQLCRGAEEASADLVQALMVKKEPPYEPTGALVAERGEAADPLRPCTSDPELRVQSPTAESLARMRTPFELDMAGTGCLLVHRRVFETLEEPWYCAASAGHGSDYNFTLRATDAGFRCVLDPRVRVGHVACHSFGLGDAVRAEAQERHREAERAARAGMVRPGP